MSPDADRLVIPYAPTEKSIVAAMLCVANFPAMYGTAAAGGAAMAVFFGFTIFDWSTPEAVRGSLIGCVLEGLGMAGALFAYLRFMLFPVLARTILRKHAAYYAHSSVVVREDGVSFLSTNTQATYGWAELQGYHRTNDALVIVADKSLWFSIPTAGTPDADLAALQARLAGRIPELGKRRRR